jgi:hypothetical protein
MSLGETMRAEVFLVLLVSGCAAQGGYGGYDEGIEQSSSWTPAYQYQTMAPPAAPGPNPVYSGVPYYVSAPPRGACTTLHIAAPC